MYNQLIYKIKKILPLLFIALAIHQPGFTQRPNIIYIMTDDMGYGDLSAYGRKDYSTPHLDKLMSQSMKFVNAYSAGPLCTPTRTAFITGRYPAKTPVGLMEPLTSTKVDSSFGLSADYPSVATLMRAAGYKTALIGKWHLGLLPQHSPLKNGLDYFWGIRSGAADYISHNGDGRKPDLYENENLVSAPGYLTDLITQKAIDFIKTKHGKPFFLTLTYTAPHWPWQGPLDKAYEDSKGFREGGSPAVYAAMMQSLDEGIGRLLKSLDDELLSGQTIVIFTNDNGGERYSDNGGFAKSKGTLWEGGIRVPAFVRWPGKIKPGTVSQQVVTTMDWTASILASAKAKPHPRFPLDGINLLPVLTGKKAEIKRTLYWRTFQRIKSKAIRDGNWKYLQDEKGEYLFDLNADPGEKMDLKLEQVVLFNQLKEKLSNWEKTVLQPIPL